MADDASVVVGSRLLCLGNQEHPKLTLFRSRSERFWMTLFFSLLPSTDSKLTPGTFMMTE